MYGNPVATNAYDEYGVPKPDPYGNPGAGNTGRFQYTGQAWIPELGMYYYKARIYSPTLGRFLQTDPIGYDDQINLYAYVGNDPANKTDPTGNYGDIYPTRKWDPPSESEPISPETREKIAIAVEVIGIVWDVATLPTGVASGPEGVVLGKTIATGIRKGGAAGGERAGKAHTRGAIREAARRNAERSGGVVKCVKCNGATTPTTRRAAGSTVAPSERQGGHTISKSRGGDGATIKDQRNIQMECAKCNNRDGNRKDPE